MIQTKKILKLFLTVAFLMLSLPQQSLAQPKAIILLRHAEEPPEDVPYLSETGQKRAMALPSLFKTNPYLKNLETPVALFAAGAKKADSSIRSIQTLKYLSEEFQIPVNHSFIRDDYEKMTEEINKNPDYNQKVIVICWQHKLLSKIAKNLGYEIPYDYPSGRFDRLWIILSEEKSKVKFLDLPQRLLPGDTVK